MLAVFIVAAVIFMLVRNHLATKDSDEVGIHDNSKSFVVLLLAARVDSDKWLMFSISLLTPQLDSGMQQLLQLQLAYVASPLLLSGAGNPGVNGSWLKESAVIQDSRLLSPFFSAFQNAGSTASLATTGVQLCQASYTNNIQK